MLKKLIGTTSAFSIAGSLVEGTIIAWQFTAEKSGTAEEVQLLTDSTPNTCTSIWFGIYANTETEEPGVLLGHVVYEGVPPIETWITQGGLEVPLKVGTKYWVAFLALGGELHHNHSVASGGTPARSSSGHTELTEATWGANKENGPTSVAIYGTQQIETYSDALFERLPSLFINDEEEGGFGKYLCKAAMSMLQRLDVIVQDTDTHPGWGIILDPLVCPEAWLPYCAMIYGIELPAGLTVQQQREYINAPPQEARGTVAAMEANAKRTLTGKKELFVIEQLEGHAYRMQVTSLTSETPSEALTKAALLAQKPAGVKLEYFVTEDVLIDQMVKLFDEIGEGVTFANMKLGEV